ncbi:beta-lactamase/transpeptidase-like protein [Canariomyces notabilis]|uniref:Beta-lactamase/transpeptidase-like protein n=1 Tax=Canariomyces notabilis TaxID=2074819 RepID=A0AAN6TLS1_9PEZI|nr:beta-lactamase/transpeptidase-like protein [Canariomyces arenarius]
MWATGHLLLVALTAATAGLAAPNCPPLGPTFEPPRNFARSGAIRAAIANLTETLRSRDQDNSPSVLANLTSYSIEVFSTSQETPVIFSWHHTASSLTATDDGNATVGVTKVDADTVYRLGSLTKTFTIYTWLVQDGDSKWDEPITKYVPELAAAAERAKLDPVGNVPWDEVTIGSLAGQLSGAIRDCERPAMLAALGFPPLNSSDLTLPPCGAWPLCNRTEFFRGLLQAPPSYAPFTTPAYTNTGFQILAYALESIKGKSFESMMQESVLRPLGLNHTFYTAAPAEVGIIPGGNLSAAGWNYHLGDENPAGNMFSSIADISALGRAILRSDLIPPSLTRRWLKPASYSSELIAGVGYPWGVRRIPLSSYGANGKRVVDAYNKAGRIGYYASLLVLLPDYDAGLSILVAGPNIPGNTNWNLADLVGTHMVPALEAAAREQADARYAGEYTYSAGNSSIRLTTQSDRPGLGVESWVSNGTDMKLVGVVLSAGYQPVDPSIRLYPTGLETVREDGSKRVAFKGVFEDLNLPSRPDSMFSTDCGTWVSLTGVTYGTYPLDQFVFEIGRDGRVRSVENLALRVAMGKKG